MEGRKGKLQVVLAAALAVAVRVAVPGAQEASAAGTLTLNGKAIALAHVYASPRPGLLAKDAEDIHVLLTDVPLSDEARDDAFALLRLARAGKAHALEIVIDARGEPLSGAIYSAGFNGMASLSGMHRFEPARMERSVIAGRLSMDGVRTFMDVTYGYDVRFSAPIPRPPTEAELAAALASPPATAAAQHVTTILSGDYDAFLQTLSGAAAARFGGNDGAARFAQLRREMPRDTRPVSVRPGPAGAVLVSVEGQQDGVAIEYVLKMVEEAGRWKVGP